MKPAKGEGSMFCTNCEFEIKGDDRRVCPVCGGPLIDYSQIEAVSEEMNGTRETPRWEKTVSALRQPVPFDLGKALEADDAYPLRKPEEHAPLLTQSGPDMRDEAVAQQTRIGSSHSSRKQLVLSVMVVLALLVAIATVAIFKPQQKLYPALEPLKTKTEKNVATILSMLTQGEERTAAVQRSSEGIPPLQPGKRGPAARGVAAHKQAPRSGAPAPGLPGEGQSLAMKGPAKKALPAETALANPPEKQHSQRGFYSIHAGSYKDRAVAAGERDRLEKMGLPASLQTVVLENGQTWHRIKIGHYGTGEEAESALNELKRKAPELKSYIMRRVPAAATTAEKREGEPPIATAAITPFVLEAASYPLPPLEETPRAAGESGEPLPLLNESPAPEMEHLITERAGDAYRRSFVEQALPPEEMVDDVIDVVTPVE